MQENISRSWYWLHKLIQRKEITTSLKKKNPLELILDCCLKITIDNTKNEKNACFQHARNSLGNDKLKARAACREKAKMLSLVSILFSAWPQVLSMLVCCYFILLQLSRLVSFPHLLMAPRAAQLVLSKSGSVSYLEEPYISGWKLGLDHMSNTDPVIQIKQMAWDNLVFNNVHS